jgi:hypothetical protein
VVDDVECGGVVVGALHLLGGGAALRVAVGASVVSPGVLGAQDVLLSVLAPAVPVVGGAADAHLAGPPRHGLAPLGAERVVRVGPGVAERAGRAGAGRRGGGGGDADGAVGERDDLGGEAAALVQGVGGVGRVQVELQLAHQLLHAAQLRHQLLLLLLLAVHRGVSSVREGVIGDALERAGWG